MAEEAGCPTSTGISWVLSMPLHLFVVTLGLSIFRSSRKGQLGKRKHTNFACLCHPCFLPLFMVTHNQSSAKDNSSSPAELTRLPLFWLESTQPTMSPARVYCNALYSMIYRFIIVRCTVWFIFSNSMMLGVKRPRLSFTAALSDGGAHKSEGEGKQTSARTPARASQCPVW